MKIMKKNPLLSSVRLPSFRTAAVIGGSLALALSGCAVKEDAPSEAPAPQEEASASEEPAGGIATVGGGQDSAKSSEAARTAVQTAVAEVSDSGQAVGLKKEDDGWLVTVYDVTTYDGGKNTPVHVSADGAEVTAKDKAENPPSGATNEYSLMRQTVDQAIQSATRNTRGEVVEVGPDEKDGQLAWKVSIKQDDADKPKDIYVHHRSGDVL